MRILKIVLIVLIIGGLTVPLSSCGSESDSESENQVVTVQRGDLTVDITAVGNLALSLKEDLAFEISGTVEEVLVEEGDSVEEGQVLARLDTSEWQDELAALEDQVTAQKRNLLQALISLTNAETALEEAEETYSKEEINNAREALDLAEDSLESAELKLEEAEASGTEEEILQRRKEVLQAKESLLSAEAKLETMLEGPDLGNIAIKQLQVELARGQLEDAEEAVGDAEEALNEALEASPEVTAPFDGFITSVSVAGGDEVKKGTVAVTLADPDEFEADILVGETDIFYVSLGGQAWVQVDALSGVSLPAEVTHISPTAAIQSGVVNYTVKVKLQSLEAVMQEQQEAMQEAMPDISSEIPERLQQAIEEGQITQEQLEEMMKQVQQVQVGQLGQVSTAMPEGFQLREGLTVTVSIIVDERSGVLLVPNGAITTRGMQAIVQVLSADGTIEERTVTTGISDWQYTEVTSGLSEGEQVIVPEGTTTTPTPQQGPTERIFIPGMGGPR